MGFNGIAATFLGGLHPIGTIFASFFIQSITDGGALINKSIYPSQISDLISAIIIYLCGFVLFFKFAINNWITFFAGVVLFTAIYAVLMYLFAMNDYEKDIIRKPLQRILKRG